MGTGFTHTEDLVKSLVQAIVLGTGLNPIRKLLLFDENGVMLNDPYYYNWIRYPTSSGIYITGRARITQGGLVKRISAPIADNHSLFYFHYTLDEPVGVDANTEAPASMTAVVDVPLVVEEGVERVANMIPRYVGQVLAGVYFPSVLKPRYLKVYGQYTISGSVRVEMLTQTKCVIRGSVKTPFGFSTSSIAVANSDNEDLIVIVPPGRNYETVEVEITVGV